MKKTLKLARLRNGRGKRALWVMSMWTGEIVRPWEIRKIFGLIRDFAL